MTEDTFSGFDWSYDINRWLKQRNYDKVNLLKNNGVNIKKGVLSYIRYVCNFRSSNEHLTDYFLDLIEEYDYFYDSLIYRNICRYFLDIKLNQIEGVEKNILERVDFLLKKYITKISPRSHYKFLEDIMYFYQDNIVVTIKELNKLNINFLSNKGKLFFDIRYRQIFLNNDLCRNLYIYNPDIIKRKIKDLEKLHNIIRKKLPENKKVRCDECLIKITCNQFCGKNLIVNK